MAKLEDIVSLCKRRGFIFQGSDVYGGMAGTWDFVRLCKPGGSIGLRTVKTCLVLTLPLL